MAETCRWARDYEPVSRVGKTTLTFRCDLDAGHGGTHHDPTYEARWHHGNGAYQTRPHEKRTRA